MNKDKLLNLNCEGGRIYLIFVKCYDMPCFTSRILNKQCIQHVMKDPPDIRFPIDKNDISV